MHFILSFRGLSLFLDWCLCRGITLGGTSQNSIPSFPFSRGGPPKKATRYALDRQMSMKAVVQRAIAKHTVDVSKAPFLTMLLQPASKRNFTKEIEQWISEHDVVALLENLASHLLRSLPTDEMDETDRWIDAQKKSRGGVSAIAEADIVDRVSLENDGTRSVEEARWLGREVTVLTVFRKLPSSSAKDASRSHVHRIACMAASLPLLPPLRHENLLPCLGYSVGEAVLSTVHPKLTDVKSVRDMLQQQQQCSLLTPHVSVAVCLRMASDVLNALSYLHALGFLHRHLTLDSVFYVKEGTLQESSRPVPQAGRFVLGGFDFMVRTSRGHFTSHAWMPKNAPPETLQTRTYTTASDIFGVGMLVLECANYGSPVDCCVGVPSRPDWLPSALWDGLLSSALALVADNRPSASELRNTIEELLQTQEALGRAIIATPAERQHINSDELTALVVSGAPQDITTTEHIELCGSTIKWELACKAAAGNQHVTTLCVADCSVPRNSVLPRWAALTQLKLRAVCRVCLSISSRAPALTRHSHCSRSAALLDHSGLVR